MKWQEARWLDKHISQYAFLLCNFWEKSNQIKCVLGIYLVYFQQTVQLWKILIRTNKNT